MDYIAEISKHTRSDKTDISVSDNRYFHNSKS
jgi:hypothetical protein